MDTRSQDSIVGIATVLRARRFAIPIPVREKFFTFSKMSRSILGSTQAPVLCLLLSFPGVKRWGRKFITDMHLVPR
jgi:hypothetical protein